MTLRSVLRRMIFRKSLNQPENPNNYEEVRQRPTCPATQTELVELFGAELREHDLLRDATQSRTPKP
ncbi:hypothetical protein SAMN05444358_101313 [Ruegeria halocynthiae]|uniref:Uncharacterized protein n=1 Tax=Ruegeria halocynthiae TaxID=985054 RepID=A0A1H2RZS5_9RHOB|nr:hypothetical protein [Ruegeria halocynthiae]SDW24807.1 hypothetical protein SAMN05444358_101313 [Ruegeria halocynthiae]